MQAEYKSWERTRPFRFAFLVEEGDQADAILDGIFEDCYNRWGGRYSLIVPCKNGQICEAYWPWLESFDPDLVYSYADLSRDAILAIHRRVYPGDYIFHEYNGDVHRQSFRPKYDFAAVSSLSVIFSVARTGRWSDAGRLRILDCWHTEATSRFFADNFGSYHGSTGGSIFPADAKASASLLTLISPETRAKKNLGLPRDLELIPDDVSALKSMTEGGAVGLSQLSAILAEQPSYHSHKWSKSFNLVLGDKFADRVMFWNLRLYIPGWLNGEISCLRMTVDQLKDPEILAILKSFFTIRNRITNGSGGQPGVTIRSVSATDGELQLAKALLDGESPWKSTRTENFANLEDIVPAPDTLKHAVDAQVVWGQLDSRPGWTAFSRTGRSVSPPVVPPAHFADAPPKQYFTRGFWTVEYVFEDASEAGWGARPNRWTLPRSWRFATAFSITRKGSDRSIPLRVRAALNGCLAVPTAIEAATDVLRIPDFRTAIRYAFYRDGYRANETATGSAVYPMPKIASCEPSSEQPYLSGVLGMAGGVESAANFLLHPFLRREFEKLGASTRATDQDLREPLEIVQKVAQGNPKLDLSDESQREWLAETIVRKARQLSMPTGFVSYDSLKANWRAFRDEDEATRERFASGGSEFAWTEYHDQSLDESLMALRRRKLFFQGHRWLCQGCNHHNWTDMTELAPELECEVCRTGTQAPVNVKWLFRPNDFLVQSLRDHSVLSLIWVIQEFGNRAKNSFQYAGPTAFMVTPHARPDFEADVVMTVDGKTFLAEIKTSWRSVRAKDVQKLVELSELLCPDVALLAVMEDGLKQQVEIAKARQRLESLGIELQIITPAHTRPYDSIYLPVE